MKNLLCRLRHAFNNHVPQPCGAGGSGIQQGAARYKLRGDKKSLRQTHTTQRRK